MDFEQLKNEILEQTERNRRRYGIQPHATLILEMEDQMRLINLGSLIWAIAEEL